MPSKKPSTSPTAGPGNDAPDAIAGKRHEPAASRPLRLDSDDRRDPPVHDTHGGAMDEMLLPPTNRHEGDAPPGHGPDSDDTVEDRSPQNLVDEQKEARGDAATGAVAQGTAADSLLREVTVDEIGGGDGLDEAELAEVDPVGRDEAKRLERKAKQHARDPNAFEPAEAEERRAAAEAKARATQESQEHRPRM